ncbi:MAG: hypothetical protein QUV02_10830 [Maricaulis sp.]|uniref:hypothetical protein n=1 Tax=Maricaulis sp. TaxID=1486257 RepID=UPI002622EC20|nr:hypothetical protein [Maricaulis sp.]MDM7984937.1 hypothetical protein [Maricaulis sp.]
MTVKLLIKIISSIQDVASTFNFRRGNIELIEPFGDIRVRHMQMLELQRFANKCHRSVHFLRKADHELVVLQKFDRGLKTPSPEPSG